MYRREEKRMPSFILRVTGNAAWVEEYFGIPLNDVTTQVFIYICLFTSLVVRGT